MDPRFHKLAAVLTGFSAAVTQDDNVLIDTFDIPLEMTLALVQAVRQRKANPFVNLRSARVQRELTLGCTPQQMEVLAEVELNQMRHMQCYIALRGSHNIFESSDIPQANMASWLQAMKPVIDYRVSQTRWVVLRWPYPSMAQQAMMSTQAFENFYFDVCTMDYARMAEGMTALKARMEATRNVHLTATGTDLRFSIEKIPAIMCGGRHNIPDGEVFTAPIRDSVEGFITYNVPTVYQGISFDNVRLEFEQGKIVRATSSNTRRLNEILDQDEGARYIGEFAIAFNPHIKEPIRDILFDEKIAGSFHFTPGQAYEEADNGNRSQVHWDLICIQRPEYGGGEIRFDGEVIRKDGLFVVPELDLLNPNHLLKR